MTFDFADVVNFTSIFELFFFIIFIVARFWKPYYNKVLTIFFISQILGILSWILKKYSISSDTSIFLETFSLLWAPSLFIYAEALTKRREKPSIYVLYHSLPFIIILLYNLISFVVDIPPSPVGEMVTAQVIIYNLAGLYILAKYHISVKQNFSKDESTSRNWVAVVLLGYALSCMIPPIAYYLGIYQSQSDTIKEIISFFPFLIFYNILFFNALSNPVVIHEIPQKEKYSGSLLDDETAKDYLQKLDAVIESKKCFLESELTLNELAEISGIPGRYLSQIINQYKNKSFYDYINGLRTDFACYLLEADSRKTILEILYESGFNSKTSFNTAFKKHTGFTPSQYKLKNRKNGSDS